MVTCQESLRHRENNRFFVINQVQQAMSHPDQGAAAQPPHAITYYKSWRGQNRSMSHVVIWKRSAARHWNRASEDPWTILGRKPVHSSNISWNFRFSKFRVMEPDLGDDNLRRYKFVSRFGHTKRKPWPPKPLEKSRLLKRIHRFRAIRGWTPR